MSAAKPLPEGVSWITAPIKISENGGLEAIYQNEQGQQLAVRVIGNIQKAYTYIDNLKLAFVVSITGRGSPANSRDETISVDLPEDLHQNSLNIQLDFLEIESSYSWECWIDPLITKQPSGLEDIHKLISGDDPVHIHDFGRPSLLSAEIRCLGGRLKMTLGGHFRTVKSGRPRAKLIGIDSKVIVDGLDAENMYNLFVKSEPI